MDAESDELNSCSQTVYNILHILTLLNFKVLFPKLMLNAWCLYCYQAVTLIVVSDMQAFC